MMDERASNTPYTVNKIPVFKHTNVLCGIGRFKS